MKRLILLLLAAAVVAALAAGPSAAKSGLTITVRDTRYGEILTDGDGRVLYLFTADKGRRSVCYGACAAAWPVAYAGGAPRAGAGAKASLVGTTRRKGGRRQVTYRGRPLYYYVGDHAPAQVSCQNVSEFGGLWLVVRPSGRAVRGS